MSRTKKIVFHGLFIALLVASAKVSFTVIPPVPFTLQSAVVITCALVLGWQSVITVGLYVAMGLAGLPVFAAGGGIGYVLYSTFGFTIGFLFCALICGLLYAKFRTVKGSVLAVSVGTVVIYFCGILYYLIIKKFYFAESVDFWKIILTFYVVFIPSDIIKGVVCIIIAKRLQPITLQ